MDVYEVDETRGKQSTVSAKRLPLVPADNKNGPARPAKTRELASRYRSPTQSAATGPKRCPSPAEKRATSAERKRPSRPSSPSTPSTPIEDTSAESRKVVGNRLTESLWPSTMRSLSVSFQSDTIYIPTSKKEKPVSRVHCDRTLRLSSNVARREAEVSAPRKTSPVKGKNYPNRSENSKPDDSLHPRLTNQHLWPSRASGTVSTATNRSSNVVTKARNLGMVTPSVRRLSLDGKVKPLQKLTRDSLMIISCSNNEEVMSSRCSDDLSRPSNGTKPAHDIARTLSLPTPGSHPASPSVSRGVSPSRVKTETCSSRGSSPARLRPSSPSMHPRNSTSVLSFMADIKKGKKAANHIEDVHQLRMLYNRHVQWRYANAQTAAALRSQKVKAEKTLHGVWRRIADLRDSVMEKRINFQHLRLKLNLYSVLNDQLTYLNEWALIEDDHHNSLTGTTQDLQSSTIRVPLTGRATGDIETVKAAVCSAVDVMQAMGSSLSSVRSTVEGMNCLVSELAEVAARERAILVEFESILGSTAALQDKECSLWTHLLQAKQSWEKPRAINILR